MDEMEYLEHLKAALSQFLPQQYREFQLQILPSGGKRGPNSMPPIEVKAEFPQFPTFDIQEIGRKLNWQIVKAVDDFTLHGIFLDRQLTLIFDGPV
ncbi:MAG TPA: hypothetical protein VFE46_13160 [Pirellulales bacterium]|jgi:hypothetical protein|nr:hypothetical protein [Pirellulales bacterium]